MARATTCLLDGQQIDVDEALELRQKAKRRDLPLNFRCIECGQMVRVHRASDYGAAHFEHLHRNPECQLSDISR